MEPVMQLKAWTSLQFSKEKQASHPYLLNLKFWALWIRRSFVTVIMPFKIISIFISCWTFQEAETCGITSHSAEEDSQRTRLSFTSVKWYLLLSIVISCPSYTVRPNPLSLHPPPFSYLPPLPTRKHMHTYTHRGYKTRKYPPKWRRIHQTNWFWCVQVAPWY
jgi:hypothetical protein